MNIGFPGLVREQKLRGYLETRRPVLLELSGHKKNGMWVLRKDSLESLRQEGASGTGFIPLCQYIVGHFPLYSLV